MLLFVWALPPEGSKGVSDLVMMGGYVAKHRPSGKQNQVPHPMEATYWQKACKVW